MFSLVLAQSRLYIATIVFYTCVYVPYLQMKRALMSLMGFIPPMEFQTTPLYFHNADNPEEVQEAISVGKFQELVQCVESPRTVDEQCSVCLVEFQSEEEVSQLSGCRHVFHNSCIRSWLLRNQFTCPLCRSVFLVTVRT